MRDNPRSERVYYETAFSGLLAEGILLRDDYMNDAGDHGYLVECVGVAPIEDQPFDPDDPWPGSAWDDGVTVREAHKIFDPYLSGEDRADGKELHVVWPSDVVRRFETEDEEGMIV